MLVCAVAMTAAPLHAQEPQQQQAQPAQQQREHVVRKGDTLWDLARFYLNDPFRWPMIYEANRPVVEDPHWIYPQERIIIPGLMPTVDSMRAPEVVVADVTEPPRRSRFYVEPAAPREPTVLSSEQQADAIVRPEEWIAAPWLARESELGVLGEIVAPVDPRVNDDKLPHTFHPRSRAYLSFPANIGNRFLVVRLKQRVAGHGWVVQPMGIVRVDTVGGTTSRAMVTSQFADMKVGDLVMPLPQVPAIPTVEPRAVSSQTVGRVIDVLDEQPIYGATDIAFVDLGASQGMHIGDEIVAFLPERRVSQGLRSHTVPGEPVAQMKIIKVTPNSATVRITRVQHAVFDVDIPVRIARQQP